MHGIHAALDDELNQLLRLVGGDDLDDLQFASADRDLDFGVSSEDDDDAAFERWLTQLAARGAQRDRTRVRH